jgi:putative heme-binding domain-containing protein
MLEQQLLKEDPSVLAEAARKLGDPARGAIVFHQPALTCTQCHTSAGGNEQLGPELAKIGSEVKNVYLVESMLEPSKEIKKGFESITLVTVDGLVVTGLLVEDRAEEVLLREPTPEGKVLTFAKEEIDERNDAALSAMPAGLMNQLTSRQQFLDLLAYLIEIAAHGPERELQLRPHPSTYAMLPLPEYENNIDHAGMMSDWKPGNFQRGEEIYLSLCANCHGTHDQAGSLPTSRRFASDPLKNGADPYSMYQTLTKGFGMMVAQTWMVPRQKYDVIYYLREAYLRSDNPTQYRPLDSEYLASLPVGTQRGPEPVKFEPWVNMDYGPSLTATYEVSDDGSNFAYKGIAIRLDPGPGGVSRGRYWMLYDHDTLQMSAAWDGAGFIDWNGINFNGRHQVIPRIAGNIDIVNDYGPGWADPDGGGWQDPRLRGLDGRPYGPLPRPWAHYQGLYYSADRTLISYSVGETSLLESPAVELSGATPVYTRDFEIGPGSADLVLQVAKHPKTSARLNIEDVSSVSNSPGVAILAPPVIGTTPASNSGEALRFDGATYVEVEDARDFDMTERDFTIFARIKTTLGGTIFCKTAPSDEWIADGKSFFVRAGRLVFDIGWVGAVRSDKRVDDDRWHSVALVWQADSAATHIFVDGKSSAAGDIAPRAAVEGHVARIGFTATNFPRDKTYFHGRIEDVRFYQTALSEDVVARLSREQGGKATAAVARWPLSSVEEDTTEDVTGHGHTGLVRGATTQFDQNLPLVAGVRGDIDGLEWRTDNSGRLRLNVPATPTIRRFALWMARADATDKQLNIDALTRSDATPENLSKLTHGGPRRWTEEVTTEAVIGPSDDPFAVDVLTYPLNNPWLCRARLTGFDFLAGGDQAALSSWDGNVWLVSGIDGPAEKLTWRRIASGLFQPLGLKVIDGKIHVTCRDQIVILHDLNGDGETDFYENFNNDHQVTAHFHEFAMGLQTDAEGNLYFAKGARHGLPPLVPHHGTLIRVSKDGLKSEILATGFRAPNGVCVNPDGTFFLTDQEGHWMPKNRINSIPGERRFYGNMWGYHDGSDESDQAMEQPLCWITNSFDRSPAELLWVDSEAWGPLQGALLNLSYGYGKVYIVPHEKAHKRLQGGMCELPIEQFPTGVMRGRFHPGNGQLYLAGMYSWAGNQQEPGGFFRLRYTGKPPRLPVGLSARREGMKITFSDEVDPESALNPENYAVKIWGLERTANYGSDHIGEKPLAVKRVELSDDRRSVLLRMPDLRPTWCMEIRYSLKSAGGLPIDGTIHNTVHYLKEKGEQ